MVALPTPGFLTRLCIEWPVCDDPLGLTAASWAVVSTILFPTSPWCFLGTIYFDTTHGAGGCQTFLDSQFNPRNWARKIEGAFKPLGHKRLQGKLLVYRLAGFYRSETAGWAADSHCHVVVPTLQGY